MNLSCHAVFSPDFVLADPARANGVSVTVCACRFPVSEQIFHLFGGCDCSEIITLKACLESLEYRLTGKPLAFSITVAVFAAAALTVTAVSFVRRWICFAVRPPVYLFHRVFRC